MTTVHDFVADPSVLQRLQLPGAEVLLAPAWLARSEADALFGALRCGIPWQRHRLRLFGREVEAPRLSGWIGDPGAVYTYSRTRFEPLPWTPALAVLRERLTIALGVRFNGVLANLYRDGRDSMGWHADDEPELGPEPVIASLSLGQPRDFLLRRRAPPCRIERIELGHGSLLLMRGPTQRYWQHALPRRSQRIGPRINLTFRGIVC